MIEFQQDARAIKLVYRPDLPPYDWANEELRKHQFVTISRVFHFEDRDVVREANPDSQDEDWITFEFGVREGAYFRISARMLSLNDDLFIDVDRKWHRKHFILPQNISVFRKIDAVTAGAVRIGGDEPPNLPLEEFDRLLKLFPTTHELRKYSVARVEAAVRDYLRAGTEEEEAYQIYLNNRLSRDRGDTVETVREPERLKYQMLHASLTRMLSDSDAYSEHDWQKKILEIILLLYPKYIHVIEGLETKDHEQNKKRIIDLTVLDAAGNIDIVEIKKPFASCLVSRSTYRDNFVPKRELSGSIMQCEKYLYHLSRSGVAGEKALNKKYKSTIPGGVSIKIVNPSAIIIAGRDNNMSADQRADFEFMRRKYKSIVDIITYDDLLDRLDRLIQKYS